MASFLFYFFLLSLSTISALAILSPERTSTPTNKHHLRRSRHPASSQGAFKPRDSGCITQYGVIKVTSKDPTLNGYLAPPSALKDGAYGLVTNNSRDALKVSYCDNSTFFDVVALNGPFAESGYPAIGGAQNHLLYNWNPEGSALTVFAILVGMERGIQGPPKPANHTMHRTFDPQFDAQSAMWTIDGTKSFVSHWEDKRGDPAPVELGYTVSRILPGDGPRFVAVQYRTTAQLRSPGHDITPVNFVFVPN